MEAQMKTLSLEQQEEVPALIAGAAERIRGFITATPQQIEIIRPEEFCRSPDFCKDQNLDTVTFIYKVERRGPDPYRVEFLSRASEEALVRSINLGDASALERAVSYGSLAVYHLDREMPERGVVISAFARTLRQRWNVSKQESQLDDAIYYFRKAVEVEPLEEANRSLHLDDLARALMHRYELHKKQSDFDEAKATFEQAIGLEHSATPAFFSGLGQLLLTKANFENPRDPLAFAESIEIFHSALSSITDQFKGSVATIHFCLGQAYTAKYLAGADVFSWQKATEAFDEAISRLKPPSSNHLSICYKIGRVYSDIFGKLGQLEFNDKAQACYKLALQSSPDDPTVLASWAEDLRFRAHCTGSQTPLEEAIKLIQKAVEATKHGDAELPFRLGQQANALIDRFVLCGIVADLNQALAVLWRSLETPGLKNEARWEYWEMLAHGFLLRSENLQDIDDLHNAEMAINSALELGGLKTQSTAQCLRVLGKIFFHKYVVNRDSEDLDKSIKEYQSSIKLADNDSRTVYTTYNDLGNSHLEKFELSKANIDIQAAATSYHQALEKLRSCRTKSARGDEAMLLHGLGNVQFRQFQHWGRTADLDTAISYYKKSLDATSDSNVRIATRTGTFCWALQQRFEISPRIEDLEDAKRRLEAVVALPLQLSTTAKSYVENRIGIIYLRFFLYINDIDHLDHAATHFRNALATGCKEPAYNVSASNNLAITLQHKSNMTKSREDITAAIVQFSSLLQLLKLSDPETCSIVANVADFFSSLHDAQKNPMTGKLALAAYLMAVQMLQIGRVGPKRKIDVKMKAARLSFTIAKDATLASNILKDAIEDLPEAILAGLNRGDQLRAIRDFSWLPSNAAAFTVADGKLAAEALKLFESSRGIIWDNLLNERSGIGSLEVEHIELAERFKQLRAKLAQTIPANKHVDPEMDIILRRQDAHRASLEYNEVLTDIRKLEGFENFLRIPQGPSSLSDYAVDGPVVIINSNEFRSDCFIVRHEGVTSLPLPNMTFEASAEYAAKYIVALSDMGQIPDKALESFGEVLKWLWTAIAEPIMKEIGLIYPTGSEQKLPRVWWMATGWISMLPIHAAGDHRRAVATAEPCSVIDLVTSSYCNSLRSLKYARDTFAAYKPSMVGSAVLVKMPETPDHESLPGVAKEVAVILDTMNISKVRTQVLDTPTRDTVMPYLKSSSIAHFACHGIIDAEDPSLSKLVLQDWRQRPLNIRTLLRTKSLNCKLVFLSACESAVGKDLKLREEGIHIAGGFQMAGVPHVVGTLWKVEDEFGVQLAGEFYRGLEKEKEIEIGKSSESLRKATLGARARGVDPLIWAAYIHYGP